MSEVPASAICKTIEMGMSQMEGVGMNEKRDEIGYGGAQDASTCKSIPGVGVVGCGQCA